MKKGFCVVAIALAMVLAAGTAYSWDFTDHVTIAPNGKGDAMIFPFWVATSGFETNFYVTNTSDDYSVVAKVVLRSQKYTAEVLDYFIFMSPNDVYKGDHQEHAQRCRADMRRRFHDFGFGFGKQSDLGESAESVQGIEDTGLVKIMWRLAIWRFLRSLIIRLKRIRTDLTVPKNAVLDAFGGVDELGNNNVQSLAPIGILA